MNGNRPMVPMLALIAAGILGAGVAAAQMPDAPRAPHPEGAHPMHGFERLHKQLALNAQQEELWKKAQDAQHGAFKSLRAKGEETRAKLRVEIDKPGVDLKQFAQDRDRLRDEMRAQMDTARKQVRTAWFGVYDSLDAKQKEQVRVAIRDGMDRMSHHGGRHGGPRGDMHGERFGQAFGDPGEG